jgi:hypothetical protein
MKKSREKHGLIHEYQIGKLENACLLVIVQESHGWTTLAFGLTKYFLGDVVLT